MCIRDRETPVADTSDQTPQAAPTRQASSRTDPTDTTAHYSRQQTHESDAPWPSPPTLIRSDAESPHPSGTGDPATPPRKTAKYSSDPPTRTRSPAASNTPARSSRSTGRYSPQPRSRDRYPPQPTPPC